MPIVSVTRARVRSIWFMVPFGLSTQGVIGQAMQAEGFLGGALLPDRRWTFWTMTAWRDEDTMNAFVMTDPHRAAMPKFAAWCDEASVVHWEQPQATLPRWPEVDSRMRREGRPLKLRRPNPDHQTMTFPPPRLGGGGTIAPAPQP